MRDNRIVMPTSLRERAVALAHEGHQELVKTKKLLREKVWFPGIDECVKQAISKCMACQANGPEDRSHPFTTRTMAHSPCGFLWPLSHWRVPFCCHRCLHVFLRLKSSIPRLQKQPFQSSIEFSQHTEFHELYEVIMVPRLPAKNSKCICWEMASIIKRSLPSLATSQLGSKKFYEAPHQSYPFS